MTVRLVTIDDEAGQETTDHPNWKEAISFLNNEVQGDPVVTAYFLDSCEMPDEEEEPPPPTAPTAPTELTMDCRPYRTLSYNAPTSVAKPWKEPTTMIYGTYDQLVEAADLFLIYDKGLDQPSIITRAELEKNGGANMAPTYAIPTKRQLEARHQFTAVQVRTNRPQSYRIEKVKD